MGGGSSRASRAAAGPVTEVPVIAVMLAMVPFSRVDDPGLSPAA
jgi:hypothetical protein